MKKKKANREVLAAKLLRGEDFLIWVEAEQGYFRPMYGSKIALGYLCAVIRGDQRWMQASICKITGESLIYEGRGDTKGHMHYEVEELPCHDGRTPAKLACMPKSRIPCLLRRVNPKLVEKYFEEDDEEYNPYFGAFWD